MDEYIKYLNELFKSEKDINELDIDKIIDASYEYHSEMAELFKKYNSAFFGKDKIELSEDDYLIVCKNLNEDDHLFIKAFEHYLIANSKGHYNESLFCAFVNEYIDLYFANISLTEYGWAIHNLERLLCWCSIKFPKGKKDVYSKLYAYVENGDPFNIKYLFIAVYFIDTMPKDDSIHIDAIYKKYMNIDTVDDKNIYFYYDCFKSFLKFYKLDNSMKKIVKRDIVNFTLKHIESFDNLHIQTEFQIIRKYMDELKDYQDSDYSLIDNYLEKANKDALSKLQSIDIELPDEQKQIVDKELDRISNKFKDMDSINQIDYLMIETTPFSIEEIKKIIEKEKKSPFSFINKHFLDSEGRVINFDVLNEKQEFSLNAGWVCNTTCEFYLKFLYSVFLKHFTIDDGFKNYLNKIFTNNKMVSDERAKLLYDQFIEFFGGDYKHSVFDIVYEFEESLRYYLKNCGLNIKKKDGSGDLISINNIFNDNLKNGFRDKLLEIIDEDYYFTFKWLLTDKYGLGLRDKSAHRIKSVNLYRTMPAIYAVIHIFRIYWFMQKEL